MEALSGPVPLLGRIGTEGQRAVGTAGTGAGQAAPQMTPKLTPRLQQTLARLLDGKSEKEIARNLNLSQHTIHQYTKSLHRHFGVSSRAELLSRFIPRADQMRPPAAFHAQS